MNDGSHRLATTLAIQLFDRLEAREPTPYGDKDAIVRMSIAVDNQRGMGMVRVKGLTRFSRDDPHGRKVYLPELFHDTTSYSLDLREDTPFLLWTAINRYIDTGNGPGTHDDHDGYSYYHSYYHGWASKYGRTGSADTAASVHLDIRYIHAPGHPWYDDGSPAIWRHPFLADKGRSPSMEEEAQARSPMPRGTPARDAAGRTACSSP